MKKIKILIFIVLLSIGFSFNGELYMLYLDNFQESYFQSGFYLDRPSKEVSDDEIIRDFMNAGEKYHVDFFLIPRLLYGYSNVYFKLSFITLLFVIFLVINILLNATILHVHFKKDLAGGNNG